MTSVTGRFKRMINGFDAPYGKYKYQVNVLSRNIDGSTARCGGSVIDTQWILTAIH